MRETETGQPQEINQQIRDAQEKAEILRVRQAERAEAQALKQHAAFKDAQAQAQYARIPTEDKVEAAQTAAYNHHGPIEERVAQAQALAPQRAAEEAQRRIRETQRREEEAGRRDQKEAERVEKEFLQQQHDIEAAQAEARGL